MLLEEETPLGEYYSYIGFPPTRGEKRVVHEQTS